MTTLRELRKLASSIGIKKYSRLTKSQLEAEISKLNAATAEITTSASDNDNAPASQPANVASTQSENTAQPEALYDDDSFADAPGDNSSPDEDIPNDYNPLHIVQTWYGGNHSDAVMLRINRKYEATHYKRLYLDTSSAK